MVKIRLARIGRHLDPFYRVVVTDSRTKRDGACIEELGHYDPSKPYADAVIDSDKAVKWLLNGAIPSDTVKSMLSDKGIYASYLEAKKAKKN